MKKILTFLSAVSICLSLMGGPVFDIYPVPQKIVSTSGSASFTRTVNVVVGTSIDEVTIARAQSVLEDAGLEVLVSDKPSRSLSNLILGCSGTSDVADRRVSDLHLSREVFTLDKYDRHILSLRSGKQGSAQVIILGENTDAVFCGLSSLEQILDNGTADLPCADIFDYADIRNRGIIEGYYGVPYTAEVTKDLFRFMARYKLNTYMYGAKSDPYHSGFWGDPYPEDISEEQKRIGMLSKDMLADIASVAKQSKVNFIWAIHPGTAFASPDSTGILERIMTKFDSMYGLGVRQFGVFVDDCGLPENEATLACGAERLTELQRLIDSRWNTPGAAPADTVKPLNYVPQLYAYKWVEEDKACEFFKSLRGVPEKVNIYITGQAVWSVPNNQDLNTVKQWLGRCPSWWWNYPCNDNDETKLFTMDIFTNFKDESHIDNLARLENISGVPTLIINPMQQGEISKITLFSVADYEWNNDAFNNDRSYHAALQAVVGEKWVGALRTLAPWLRYYDNDVLAYHVKFYKMSVKEGQPRPEIILSNLRDVVDACSVLEGMASSPCESDVLFYEDLSPWLLKLKAMAGEAIRLLEGGDAVEGDLFTDPAFQFNVLRGMGTEIRLKKLRAAPSNTVLLPFIDYLRTN